MGDAIIPVSAPGKAFLIGEYAVLEGTPALVTAVDVRAVAVGPSVDRPSASSAVVHCAHARVASFLEGSGETVGPPPAVETGGFTLGQRKLGLGSSAAVAAAVVGYHLAQSGLDPHAPEVREHALAIAAAAHAEAQGGVGSGADVATAVLGGTVRFAEGRAETFAVPSWLAMGFVDAGAPAVTSSFVAAVRQAAKTDPSGYREALALLSAAALRFASACAKGLDPTRAFAEISAAVADHVAGLRVLQRVADVPILTPGIESVLRAATAAGVCGKPSGAGGGDLVVLFAPARAAIDRLAEPLRKGIGLPLLGDLHADPDGLRAEARVPTLSRLSGFFKLSVADRRRAVAKATGLAPERLAELEHANLDEQRANHMIENVVGTFAFPLAIATNFRINGKDVLVPMCVEEASVVAAASNAAKMIREGGGFAAHSDPPWMIAQIQLTFPPASASGDRYALPRSLPPASGGQERTEGRALTAQEVVAVAHDHARELLALADTAHPRLVGRGGGAREIEARALDPEMAVVHVLVDCQDAMGANLLNTVAETVAVRLAELTGWDPGLRILSNLADRRRAHVTARISPASLAGKGFTGPEVVARIVSASRFAELDPYRAATHNKGIMNGVDAVVLATGNDWRAMEASAHAYAGLTGRSPNGAVQYGPLAIWRRCEDGWLEGSMSLPAAVGVVGGATQVHPVAKIALEILGNPSSSFLGQVMAAAGLASNLAALRAMATEGIQRGHMSLHARSVALGVGATGSEVEQLAARLVETGEIKAERATALLAQIRGEHGSSAPATPTTTKGS
jgi:hydroxymethylglutaryl-CoA reductase/mevalonate kinase